MANLKVTIEVLPEAGAEPDEPNVFMLVDATCVESVSYERRCDPDGKLVDYVPRAHHVLVSGFSQLPDTVHPTSPPEST